MEPQKSIMIPVALTVLVSAIVFGGLGWYLASNQSVPATQTTATPVAQVSLTPTAKTTPTPTASTTTTPDPTVDWKAYENTAYYYSFKYPTTISLYSFTGMGSNTPITSTAQIVNVESGSNHLMEISELSTNFTLLDYIDHNWASGVNKSITDTTVSGAKGYKVAVGGATYYYVEKNGKKLQLQFDPANSVSSQIFSTFTFTK